jgi:hypothetical protein
MDKKFKPIALLNFFLNLEGEGRVEKCHAERLFERRDFSSLLKEEKFVSIPSNKNKFFLFAERGKICFYTTRRNKKQIFPLSNGSHTSTSSKQLCI